MALAQNLDRSLASTNALVAAGLVGFAWLTVFGPVYVEFAQGPWRREENAHAPFIMAIIAGVLWARLRDGDLVPATLKEAIAGAAILIGGLTLYLVGRAGDVVLFLSASQGVIAVGLAVALLGWAGARRIWFALLLTVYLIIWPGWMIDAATAPFKLFVSQTVAAGLFSFGLPVAHAGAIISAGPYELLVADACAGLNSFIALTSVGAVYLYVARRRSLAVNLIVIASLAPIAVAANILRVAVLTLLTYYGGYDVGQSFMHEGAGLLLFAFALLCVFLVDGLAALFWEPNT